MSEHLSARQIDEWVAGARSPAYENHVRECVACRLLVEEFQAVLGEFRGAARGWSEAQFAARLHPVWRPERALRQIQQHVRRPLGQSGVHWVAAAAVLCALIALFLFHGDAPRHPILAGAAHPTAIADAALMGQVDADVSQTVPQAMEPLTRLVFWDDAPQAEVSGNKQSTKEEE